MDLKFRYGYVLVVAGFHFGAIMAFFKYEHSLLLLAVSMWIIGHKALAVGYHRLLTHRGFKTPRWLEYLITLCGSLTLQGSHIKWIALHRKHHQFTEQDNDPHSPRKGFFHSYMGWMLWADPEVNTEEFTQKYAKDLCNDKFHYALSKVWFLPSTVLGLSLFYFFGFGAMLWGVLVPVTFGLHFTWMVNSVCHRFGSRMFETDDDSRNNWWVALLTFGEGWHNNHHDKPVRARHGLKWYQFDSSWIFIRTLAFFGLARDIKM